ncbi:MAG: hypothetical protein H6835_07220 [Planctomycetes bacterium]|nr:hypothetical protein [Planctomycetota bacterium]
MTGTAPRPPRASLLAPIALAALAGVVGYTGYRVLQVERQLAAQNETLSGMFAEVTRMRLEQSSEGQGPSALLEKLRVYAPMSVDSQVTEPDFQNARKQMDAVLRAFESLGHDAYAPIVARLEQADVRKDHDEITWLLRAAVRVDPVAGEHLVQEILLGYRLPSPRLRWFAAYLLTQVNKPLAQQLLRRILLTESWRGRNNERAAQYDAKVLDPAAYATTGFYNFVAHYIRSEDPEIDDTLLQVMGRAEHDQLTIKECIEELGRRKCARAAGPIEQFYAHPPVTQDDPLFLNACLDALFEIRGAALKPFLEKALATASSDVVLRHVQFLLDKLK